MNIVAQTKNCNELKGLWYYALMSGASEPVYLVFNGCEWKENENPMGNRKGTAVYSAKNKKFEIIGLADSDSGPVFLTKGKDYYYLAWTSTFSKERTYIILTREKHRGKWYDEVKKTLKAYNK